MMSDQLLPIRQRQVMPAAICGLGCLALELSCLRDGHWFPPLSNIGVVVTVTWATVTDVTRFRIPNVLTYSAFLIACVLGLAVTTLDGWLPDSAIGAVGAVGLQECLVGAATCFGVMLVVWSLAGRGGGDVKLATAVGAFVGVQAGLQIIFLAHVLAAIAALAWLCLQRGFIGTFGLLLRQIGQLVGPPSMCQLGPEERHLMQRPLPMAAYFAIASMITMCGVILS
jgi:Flp pilus assembly protein protease CpaA